MIISALTLSSNVEFQGISVPWSYSSSSWFLVFQALLVKEHCLLPYYQSYHRHHHLDYHHHYHHHHNLHQGLLSDFNRIIVHHYIIAAVCDGIQNFKRYKFWYFFPYQIFLIPIPLPFSQYQFLPIPILYSATKYFRYRYLLKSVPKMHENGSDTFEYKRKYWDRYPHLRQQRILIFLRANHHPLQQFSF